QGKLAPSGGSERHAVSERGGRTGYWVQTLKGGNQVAAGLHQRGEWESRVGGPRPELAALIALVGPGSAWAKVLSAQALAQRLAPVFITRVRRTTWLLRLPQGDEIELALDQGMVQRDAAQEPISEIELELKSGDPARLFDCALALLKAVPLRIGNLSKAGRGYALYAPQAPVVVEAMPLELAPELTVEQGFQAIARNCLAQLQGNAAGVAQGSDPESVHQMRIGLRRLRSALGLFGEVAPCPDALQQELVWLARELGAVRDWDVLVGDTLPALAAGLGAAAWAPLQQAAGAVARQNRHMAATVVCSVRYTRLLLSLGGWLQGGRWREALVQPRQDALAVPLAPFATQTLAQRHGTLKKRGQRLRGGTPQARHRVRIAAKNLRYAAEFFQSLYPTKRLRPYVAALTGLQGALGRLNDASVADALLRQLAQAHPELAPNAALARAGLVARGKRDLRRLGKLWQRFAALKPVRQ
ncbi:MAG: CYTH and CHAD domain-containing protein, partial [Polaromonas sp.]